MKIDSSVKGRKQAFIIYNVLELNIYIYIYMFMVA